MMGCSDESTVRLDDEVASEVVVIEANQPTISMPPANENGEMVSWWESKKRSFAIYPHHTEAYCSDAFRESMLHYTEIGANEVGFIVITYQDDLQSHDLYDGFNSVNYDCVRQGASYAQSLGLSVHITARVDTAAGWRRQIRPGNLNQWFINYRAFQRDVACNISAVISASSHSVGTEMKGTVSNDERSENAAGPGRVRWPEVVGAVRECYNGEVTYSWQHMDGSNSAYFDNNDLRDRLDFHGFSAYFPLYGETVEELVEEWEVIKGRIEQGLNGKPYAFLEAGARPCEESLVQPWNDQACTFNPDAQRLWWEAVLQAFSSESSQDFLGIIGGWAWEERLDQSITEPQNYNPNTYQETFDVICQYWGGSGCSSVVDVPSDPDGFSETISGEIYPFGINTSGIGNTYAKCAPGIGRWGNLQEWNDPATGQPYPSQSCYGSGDSVNDNESDDGGIEQPSNGNYTIAVNGGTIGSVVHYSADGIPYCRKIDIDRRPWDGDWSYSDDAIDPIDGSVGAGCTRPPV